MSAGDNRVAKLLAERAKELADQDRVLREDAIRICEIVLRPMFNSGDKGAILTAVFLCAGVGVPLPEWAADAFRNAYTSVKVDSLHASWDAVFGRPHGKSESLPAKRKRDRLLLRVFVAVEDLRAQKPNKDHFPEVAEKFGISVGVCKKYFYEAQDNVWVRDGDLRSILRESLATDEMVENANAEERALLKAKARASRTFKNK